MPAQHVRVLALLIAVCAISLAGCSGEAEEPVTESPTTEVAPPSTPTASRADELRKTAPTGDWQLTKLSGDSFGKDYGYWYLEDEEFKAGQSLLTVPAVDAKFVIDNCTDQLCEGHIEPSAEAVKAEPEGHLYPWGGEGQKHTFTWDGSDLTLSTTAEETEGICYDTETGEDLPGTSWTDNATYKYSEVAVKKGSDDAVEGIDAKYRVDYETVFVPYCEGPTTMFLEGAIAFQKSGAAN